MGKIWRSLIPNISDRFVPPTLNAIGISCFFGVRSTRGGASMWGQKWGEMIWGRTAAVPAVGFWCAMILGAMLGIIGFRFLRGAKPRTIGVVIVGIVLSIPLSARAVTLFTFVNGTVADASQVNANFSSLTPVSGFNEMIFNPSIGTSINLLAPSISETRAMTCTVSVEGFLIFSGATITGSAMLMPIMSENGVVTTSSAPPTNATIGNVFVEAGGITQWQASQTRQFTTTGGNAALSFGCQANASGSFANMHNFSCAVVYNCF